MIRSIHKEVLHHIDRHSASVIDMVKDIGEHPELGYKEVRTSEMVNDFLVQAGYETERGLAITGIKTRLKPDGGGPNIALMGELDGITCPEDNRADRITGATHNCGHHLQLGIMLSVAQAFRAAGIAPELGGNVSFMAAPAEEYIELEYRSELKEQQIIAGFGGKQELVRCGAFDDVDAAMMLHSQGNTPYPFAGLIQSGNGFIAERIRYIGRTAHAAAAPEEGINALNAAVLGINGIHAMRETFRDGTHSRVHFIITKGGDAVNSIPADVRLECFVRGNTIDTIQELLEKTNRAFASGGNAVGARTEIGLLSGYLPLACNASMNEVFAANARAFIPAERVGYVEHFNASTDMGDISQIMPAIHPLVGGVNGSLHAAGFEVTDYEAAVTIPAKITALTLIDLLANGAGKMKSILEKDTPRLSRQEYMALMDSFFT